MSKKTKKIIKIILAIILTSLLLVILIRNFLPREIDDITPGISCKERYVNRADILWVIPKYNGIPISENKTWCEEILQKNKTLGLHGIAHEYKEFASQISEEELQEAIEIFEECFNQTPKIFKAPQLAISKENKKLLKENGLAKRGRLNQIFRRVYHCEDEQKTSYGIVPNWMVDLL